MTTLPDSPSAPPERLRVSGPAEIVEAIPYLIGFRPERSLVAMAVAGPRRRVRVTVRADLLPDEPGRTASWRQLLDGVLRAEPDAVALAIYPAEPPTCRGLAEELPEAGLVAEVRTAFEAAGVEVLDALCVSDQRWWSYLCADPSCCPPEGTERSATSRVAAEATVAGLVVAENREQLRAEIEPVTFLAAEQAQQRLLEAEEQLGGEILAAALADPEPARALQAVRARTVELAEQLRLRWSGSGRPPTPVEAARLIVGVGDVLARDDVLFAIPPDQVAGARALWAWLTRHALPPWDPAPATLFALLAWEMGDGAVASMAVERALMSDPGYRMAGYVATALGAGLAPEMARYLRGAGPDPQLPEPPGGRRPGPAGRPGQRGRAGRKQKRKR